MGYLDQNQKGNKQLQIDAIKEELKKINGEDITVADVLGLEGRLASIEDRLTALEEPA
ncbi:hypothetical protein GCM10011418_32620 [Sphingobacterium alkalisoli]|uniref:hypothetical protein n=1 Tax=Sphingobacterium alkalisoli TaxID=1874115 RepID=UPI00145C5456|nr:hypothetical protein [Sphingobacterium alkalisoli]GGH24585.1 hypothetical protein GCM10011418_32620 [Sphingobacterium alkalisoli]